MGIQKIDDYIRQAPEDVQKILQMLRGVIYDLIRWIVQFRVAENLEKEKK